MMLHDVLRPRSTRRPPGRSVSPRHRSPFFAVPPELLAPPSTPLLPLDRWLAWFNVFATGAWLPLLHTGLGRWLALTHAAALLLPWLLARAPVRLSPWVGWLRETYPLFWIPAFWGELGMRHLLVPTAANDSLIMRVDRLLFAGHPNLTWLPTMPWPWFSETMHSFYFAYYPLLLAVPVLLVSSRCRQTIRELGLRLAVTYLACFATYLVFPVIGPLELFPRAAETHTAGIFYQLNLAMRSAGDSLGTAFPSSHTAGSIALAWLAWRRLPRWFAWVCTLVAAMVTLATVYTQNHFAVDALASVVLTPFLMLVVVPVLEGRLTRKAPGRASPLPLPALPATTEAA